MEFITTHMFPKDNKNKSNHKLIFPIEIFQTKTIKEEKKLTNYFFSFFSYSSKHAIRCDKENI